MNTRRDWIALVSLGALLESLSIGVAWSMDLGDGFIIFLGGYFALFVVYVVAVYYTIAHCRPRRALVVLMFVVAGALRVPFLFTEPALSDDLYRYIWDGRVQHDGINPYQYPPQAPQIHHLRNTVYENINNKDLPTIYPPLMETHFAAATAVSESVIGMKGTLVLADLLLIGMLTGLLKTIGASPMRALTYAWNPLVVIETAGSGHNDVLAVAFLVAAHAAVLQRRQTLSVCALAASGLFKLMGFILAPLFARSVRATSWLALPAVCLAASLPYLGADSGAFLGLLAYATRWRANDSLFQVLYLLAGSSDMAKAMALGLLAGLMGLLLLRNVPPLRGCYLFIGAILILSTTIHPWYVVWIVPYLCIYPNPAWLLLTGTVVLAYHAPFLSTPGQPWMEHGWYKLLEYGPFYILLALSAVSPRRRFLEKGRSCVL